MELMISGHQMLPWGLDERTHTVPPQAQAHRKSQKMVNLPFSLSKPWLSPRGSSSSTGKKGTSTQHGGSCHLQLRDPSRGCKGQSTPKIKAEWCLSTVLGKPEDACKFRKTVMKKITIILLGHVVLFWLPDFLVN